MTIPPFSIPTSMNLRELLDCIDSRIASLDVLEQSMQLHKDNLVVMGKHLEVEHKLLQQFVGDLQRLACGLHLLAAHDTEATKKATQARNEGV